MEQTTGWLKIRNFGTVESNGNEYGRDTFQEFE